MQEANFHSDQQEQREQKNQNIQFDDYPPPKLSPNVIIQSAHVDQYHTFFCKFPKQEGLKTRLIEQLQRHNIFFLANQPQHVYQISTSNHSLTYEAVRLSVRITNFILQIVILNVKGSSSTHNLQNLSQTKASIFQCSFSKNTIIKCISFPHTSFKDQLAMAIKEYSILKIASILGVGPKLNNIFGFDLVVYDECIEFCMEECTILDSIDDKQSEDLIKKLQILHELQIVHLDIKPQNIAFSPAQQEMVFIDFGFSDVLAERPGELTVTTFIGSLGYCSPEMMSCYDSQHLVPIDLYSNDVWALRKSFSELIQNSQDKQSLVQENRPFHGYFNNENKQLQEKVSGLFDLIFIKYALFTSSANIFKNPIFIRKLLRFKSQIILFSKELTFSHFISDLLNYFKMNFADELFLRQQYQRKNSELNKLLNYGRKAKSIEGQLSEKYASFFKGISIEQPNQIRSKLKVDFNLKELILSRKLSLQINSETYYEHFVQFTNFTVALSTFNEKIQACKILLSVTGWSVEQIQQEITFLGSCFKRLLNYYIEVAPSNCVKTIPILLCNLVILEEVAQSQLLNFLKKAMTLAFSSNFSYTIFLMRCALLKLWTKERTMTKDLIIIMNYQFQIIVLEQFNKIVHQNDKYSELILIIQKLVRIFYDEKISLSTKEYEQIKAYIQNSLLLDSQLKIEINLFFFTIMLKFNTKNVDSTSSICFMQQIILEQSHKKQKCQYFEYYHFVIFHFYQRTCNYKVLTNLIDNLNACLGNVKISQRYSIFIYYTCMKFYQIQRGPQFYSFILNRLKSNSAEKQGELLFYTVLVIFHEESEMYLKNDVQDILDQIIQVLREKFPLQRQTIVDINRNYIGNVYEMGYYLGVIVERVYRDNPNITDYLLEIRQYLQSHVDGIPCLYCKERAIAYIFTLEGFILRVKNRSEDIIKLYKHILNDYKFQVLPSGFIMVAVEKILYYAVHEKLLYNETLVEPMYRWMKAQNCWKDLFIILPKNSTTFFNLNYYVIKTQKYAQFFDIQLKMISFLPIYPSKQYTVSYAKGLYATLNNTSADNRKGLIKQYRQGNYLMIKDSAYQIIIAVYMLEMWPKDDIFTEKLLAFVVNGINYVSNMAKLVTKQKIYAHLIITPPPNKMGKKSQNRSRFKQYIFKQSLKYQPKQINFRQFKYCFCDYAYLKTNSQKTKTRNLLKFMKKYYNNLDFGVSYFETQFMVKTHFTS